MERPSAPLDLTQAPLEFISTILQHVSLKERVSCALVCKAWAKAAAVTHSSILKRGPQNINCLQQWLGKHGSYVKVLQLHECNGAALTALPCAHLQDLLLHGEGRGRRMEINRRVVGDIAAATKLTSVSLSGLTIACQQADVVSALTALPDLQQLTWRDVYCVFTPFFRRLLCDSALLQHLTMLTRLDLHSDIGAEALQHLGLLTKLQHFSIHVRQHFSIEVRPHAKEWTAAGCPGLQTLKALTTLELYNYDDDIPACAHELTALQQLEVSTATPTALIGLQVLTRLTLLRVGNLTGLSLESAPLQLPALQHLELKGRGTAPMPFLASCTQLRVLKLRVLTFKGPGSLVTSTMLQHLKLDDCGFRAADGAAGPVTWQQGFPGPGRLPHLTSLHVADMHRTQQQELYIEGVVAYCSSLRVLHAKHLHWSDSFVSALARLPGLISLHLLRFT